MERLDSLYYGTRVKCSCGRTNNILCVVDWVGKWLHQKPFQEVELLSYDKEWND